MRKDENTKIAKYQFEELSNQIIGAAIRVHKELGPGFLDSIYEEVLKVELSQNGLDFASQMAIQTKYLEVPVGLHRLDLLVQNEVIVELKAVKELADIHFAQLRPYLKATGMKVGLLLNFSKPTLEVRRVVN
ncbi:MAG: GxxExxY protein [Deltaproteobacteria bacterium]|nr:GxxExxY protein [Deltaproteobacteria bacterium]